MKTKFRIKMKKLWILAILATTFSYACSNATDTQEASEELEELENINETLDNTIQNLDDESLDMEHDIDSLLDGI